MNRKLISVGVGVLVAGGIAAAMALWKVEEAPRLTSPVKTVKVAVRHVQFKDFEAQYDLEVGKEVYIHDTDYWLRLEDFAADFVMDTKTRKVSTRSNDPNRPAAKLSLGLGDNLLYTGWFVKDEETHHRIREHGFMYKILEIRR